MFIGRRGEDGKIYLFLFSVNLGTPASQGYGNTYTVAAAAFERGTLP